MLKKGIKLSVCADLCGLSVAELTYRLEQKGYTTKGQPILNDLSKLNTQDYTPISDEIRALLKKGLKKGLDEEYLISEYKIKKGEGLACILKLRREIEAERKQLYPISQLEPYQDKYTNMYTIQIED